MTATPTRNWLDSDWQLSIEPCTAEEQNQPAGHLCESTACANVAVVLVRIAVTEDGESWFVCLDCAVANVQHELTDPEAAPNGWSGEPWCRVCGCTEDDCSNCIERTGQPCSWVERRDAGLANLCSACAP